MKKCVFCDFKGNSKGEVVLENDLCFFIQFHESIPEGSGIIIPKEHRETVFDLTHDEWEATYSLLNEAKQIIDQQFKPEGYNVGWNVGEVGGQEVFHAHLHVIPRYADELFAGRGIRYWIKQPENKRKKEIEKYKFL